MDFRVQSISRLNGDNYHDWKFAVSMLMRSRGCWNVVSGGIKKADADAADWTKKAEDGLTIIGLTVDPSQYVHIRDCTDGVAAWAALQGAYEKNSRATRISLKRQFYGFEHDTNAPMQSYVNGITDLAARLKAIGIQLTDEDITDVLIFNLQGDYSNIAASLTTAQGELKVSDVTSALLEEESRKGGPPTPFSDTSLVARDGRHPNWEIDSPRRKLPPRTNRTCFRCGRSGHIMDHCHATRTVDGKNITMEMEQDARNKVINIQEHSNFAYYDYNEASLNDLSY